MRYRLVRKSAGPVTVRQATQGLLKIPFPLIKRGEETALRVLRRRLSSYQPHHVGHAPELSAGHGKDRRKYE
jgi:hypothetical protein